MAFKMKNPFKQTVAMPLGASGALDISGSKSKYLLTEEDMQPSEKEKKCKENPSTEWKNGKCVSKKITMLRTGTSNVA